MRFETRRAPTAADAIAPDGSEVRILCGLIRGSLALFSLPPGAVADRSLTELSRNCGTWSLATVECGANPVALRR